MCTIHHSHLLKKFVKIVQIILLNSQCSCSKSLIFCLLCYCLKSVEFLSLPGLKITIIIITFESLCWYCTSFPYHCLNLLHNLIYLSCLLMLSWNCGCQIIKINAACLLCKHRYTVTLVMHHYHIISSYIPNFKKLQNLFIYFFNNQCTVKPL